MKTVAILLALLLIALSVLCLAKYFDVGFAIDGNKCIVKVANVPHLGASEYLFNIHKVLLIGFIVLIVFWRFLILRMARWWRFS